VSLSPSLSLSTRDGIPYCEQDYHAMYGIQCENCKKFITGKVLEVSPASPALWRTVEL